MHRVIHKPNHDGHMAQVGVNMGARQARSLSLAISFTKEPSVPAKISQDTDIVGSGGIVWSMARMCLPLEITQHIEDMLVTCNMPRLATRNIKMGKLPVLPS